MSGDNHIRCHVPPRAHSDNSRTEMARTPRHLSSRATSGRLRGTDLLWDISCTRCLRQALRSGADVERGGEGGELEKENATQMLKAVVDQAPPDLLREVMIYKQNLGEGQTLLLPPRCFEWGGGSRVVGKGPVGWKTRRLEFTRHVRGDSLLESYDHCLNLIYWFSIEHVTALCQLEIVRRVRR